jgi:hypothetical protein
MERQHRVRRGRFVAIAMAVTVIATSCSSGGGEEPVAEVTGGMDLAPLEGFVATFSNRGVGTELAAMDMGTGRILASLSYPQQGSGCNPHHYTMVPTDTPFEGFMGFQSCRGTSEALITSYAPTDTGNPEAGGSFQITANLTEQYGIQANHHVILRPDESVWAVGDDQYDTVSFVSTEEPYEPQKVFQISYDEDAGTAIPNVLEPGSDGKYAIDPMGEEFGPSRQDYAMWTADGDWLIAGSRNIGVMWVINGDTLEVAAAINTADGGELEYLDPDDPGKGVKLSGESTTNHGGGVTWDSEHLLVNDLGGNTTVVYDITAPDPRDWDEVKRLEWPGDAVNPYHMNFTQDGEEAWISLRSYDTYEPGVGATGVVDLETLEIEKIIEVPGFVEPHGVAVTPDDNYIIQAFSGWDTAGGGHVAYSRETFEPAYFFPTTVGAHEFVFVEMAKITNGC